MSGRLRTIDGQEHPVGDSLPPIECFRCGVCCVRYQPPLLPEEIETIAAGLGMPAKDFLDKYAQLTYVGYLLSRSEGRCVFLVYEEGGDKASCRIHSFRPKACRNWVPSLSRRECQEGLTRLKTKSKIMLANELYSSPKALDRFSENLH